MEKETLRRADAETVMVVRAQAGQLAYVEELTQRGFDVKVATSAQDASATMAEVMPHVVILSPTIPMRDHRLVHETAAAVGAVVLLIPDDTRRDAVSRDVTAASAKASKRRSKDIPPR